MMPSEVLTRKFFEAVKAAGYPVMELTGSIPASAPMMELFSVYLSSTMEEEDVTSQINPHLPISVTDKIIISHTLFFRTVCREFMKRVLADIDVEDYDFLVKHANNNAPGKRKQ